MKFTFIDCYISGGSNLKYHKGDSLIQHQKKRKKRSKMAKEIIYHIPKAFTVGSIAPAVWSFMLAAHSFGLGTSWTILHLFYEKEAASILNIPYNEVMQAALSAVTSMPTSQQASAHQAHTATSKVSTTVVVHHEHKVFLIICLYSPVCFCPSQLGFLVPFFTSYFKWHDLQAQRRARFQILFSSIWVLVLCHTCFISLV